jgi:hypothetical protein
MDLPESSDGQFYRPIGVAVSAMGTVYLADMFHCRVEASTPSG